MCKSFKIFLKKTIFNVLNSHSVYLYESMTYVPTNIISAIFILTGTRRTKSVKTQTKFNSRSTKLNVPICI